MRIKVQVDLRIICQGCGHELAASYKPDGQVLTTDKCLACEKKTQNGECKACEQKEELIKKLEKND